MIKRNILITGSPVYPIVTGASAMITGENGTTKTSRVVKVINASEQQIKFETLDAVYDLQVTRQSPLSGIMVKQTFHMLNLI